MTAEQLKKEFKIRAVPIFTVAILGLTLILTGCAPEKAVATATPPSPTPDRRTPTTQDTRVDINDLFDHLCKKSGQPTEQLTIDIGPGQIYRLGSDLSFMANSDGTVSQRADRQIQLRSDISGMMFLVGPNNFGFAGIAGGKNGHAFLYTVRDCRNGPTSLNQPIFSLN